MATLGWGDWLFNRTSAVKPFAQQTVGPEASWYRPGRRRSISVATGYRTRETAYRERGCFRGRQKPPHDGLRRMAFLCSTRSIRRNCIQSQRNGQTHVRGKDVLRVCYGRAGMVDLRILCSAGAPTNLLNGSPVFSILCMMTASLRATATAARLMPRRSLSLSPQSLRLLSCRELVRVSITTAAS